MNEVNEPSEVREFFKGKPGYFVEVGANHPVLESQTWHLEQNGWTGVLVEPLPELAKRIKEARRAKVFEVACSSPENAGRHLPFYVSGGGSTLDWEHMQPGYRVQAKIEVPIRTLDEILREAGAPRPLEFLSIDVEGHEIDVLRGFDFEHWRPQLILLEDHVGNLDKHKFLTSHNYKLVRRTNLNGWYVPANAPVDFGWKERLRLLRKYWLALPFRILRNLSRRLRQPFKDWHADRQPISG